MDPIRAADEQYDDQLLPAHPRSRVFVVPRQAAQRIARRERERAASGSRQVHDLSSSPAPSDDEGEGEGDAEPAAAAAAAAAPPAHARAGASAATGEEEEEESWVRDAPGHIAVSRVVPGSAEVDTYTCCIGARCNLSLPREVVMLGCQHVVCRPCFDEMRGARCCPICKTAAPSMGTLSNAFAMASISRLLVRCSRSSLGCTSVYAVGAGFKGDAEHHEVCPYHDEVCGDCGEEVHVQRMADHRAFCCPKRLVTCDDCQEQVVFDAKEQHDGGDVRCKGWVPCPNKCATLAILQPRTGAEAAALSAASVQLVKASQLDAHLASDCPMRRVPCRFPSCADRTLYAHLVPRHNNKRKNMALHLDSMAAAFFGGGGGGAAAQQQQHPSQRCPFSSVAMTRLLSDRFSLPRHPALSARGARSYLLARRDAGAHAHVCLYSAVVGDTRHVQIEFKTETIGRDQRAINKKVGIVLSYVAPPQAGQLGESAVRETFKAEFTLSNSDESHTLSAFPTELIARARQVGESDLHFRVQVWESTA